MYKIDTAFEKRVAHFLKFFGQIHERCLFKIPIRLGQNVYGEKGYLHEITMWRNGAPAFPYAFRAAEVHRLQ